MRGMILIAVFVGTLTILAGVIATRPDSDDKPATQQASSGDGVATSTLTSTIQPQSPTGTGGGAPTTATTDPVPTQANTGEIPPAPSPTSPTTEPVGTLPPLPQVAKPELVAPTGPLLSAVQEYYAESYDFNGFTVAFRPGAFTPERAAEVAAAAQFARDQVNQMLALNDTEPITIYLADRMFDDSCVGCQGYAAADLRQVFLLQDGSVSPDEFPSLLIHEIGHVLALNIAEPEKLFFAEGLAVWISDKAITDEGYISPMQTAAWAYKAGILPTIPQLLEAKYAGRVRARVEYDAAASFTKFFIETYGLDAYKDMYFLVASERTGPENLVNVTWAELEAQWHAWLQPQAEAQINGVDGLEWWAVGQAVAAGFGTVYDNPGPVTVEQYAALTASRLELNRGQIDAASVLANASNLAPKTAN